MKKKKIKKLIKKYKKRRNEAYKIYRESMTDDCKTVNNPSKYYASLAQTSEDNKFIKDLKKLIKNGKTTLL